jgi:hypothetical protein
MARGGPLALAILKWIAVCLPGSVIALAVYIWPTADRLLAFVVGGPSIEFLVVTSDPSDILRRGRSVEFADTVATFRKTNKPVPLALTSLVVLNASTADVGDPVNVQVAATKLPVSIGELLVQPQNYHPMNLANCDGKGVFQAHEHVGERDFCVMMKTFLKGTVVSFFLLTERSTQNLAPDIYVSVNGAVGKARPMPFGDELNGAAWVLIIKVSAVLLIVAVYAFYAGWLLRGRRKGKVGIEIGEVRPGAKEAQDDVTSD